MTTRRIPALQPSLPPGWIHRSDPARGILLAARPAPSTGPATGPPPEITLRTELHPGDDLEAWRDAALAALGTVLAAYELEDDDLYDADGLDCAYRRFGFRAEGAEVLVEQWAWLVDGVGLTLSCAVPREHYADYCDLFDALAAAVDPLVLV